MAGKYSDADLKVRMASPGWRLKRHKEAPITGTLANLLHLSHQRLRQGEPPGLIEEIETSVELDMLEVERLWRYLGLPV
ncbi:MAG: hypothetical protein ACREFW_08675 [Rhizomicrobium sp.]